MFTMLTRISESLRTNPVCSALENGFSRATSALNKSFEWLREKHSSNKSEIEKLRLVLSISTLAFLVLVDSPLFGPSLPLSQKLPTLFKICSMFTKKIVDQRTWLDSFFPKDCTWNVKLDRHISTYIIGAAQEELIYRVLIQNIFLKGVSRIAPKKMQPLIAHRLTCIWITSTFFALLHQNQWDGPIGPLFQFYSGFLFGYIYEKWGFTASTVTHLGENLSISLIFS